VLRAADLFINLRIISLKLSAVESRGANIFTTHSAAAAREALGHKSLCSRANKLLLGAFNTAQAVLLAARNRKCARQNCTLALRWQAGIPLRADAFDLFVSTFGLVISPPSSCFIHKSITAILLSTRATAPSPHPHYQFLSTLKIHFGLFLSSPKRAAKVFTPALKSARGGKRVEERKKKRAGENLIQITRSNRKLLSLSPSSRSGGRRRTRAATRLLSPKRGLPACSGFLM